MDGTPAAGRDSKADDAQRRVQGRGRTRATTPSAGCDSGPAPCGQGSEDHDGGGGRGALLPLPDRSRWHRRGAAPVVFDFHGLMEGAELAAKASRLPELGTEEGFITVVPNGRGNPISWDIAPDPEANPDMAFVGDMLDTIGAEQCIDTSRVYATGQSNSAMMTSAIACAYPDRFAAVAPVAGVMATCDSTNRPVPVLAFHGTADPILLFQRRGGQPRRFTPATPTSPTCRGGPAGRGLSAVG
ncbi:MAG: prolyl oligopeptidase family serine peptidase [Candidatus Microthrix sp.]|nr:PHB depolymerase family esterase [Candidatus Microthrix sp.]MBK6439731.1 prolyl oligopeptidase family serine peptidase [Candidatus Microthrix sp.]